MPLIATARVALYAEEHGAGPRVLMLGGSGYDLRKAPTGFDTRLGETCHMLAFDARGHGRSEKPEVTPTMADFADDAAALMDAVGWERAHVVGYSFGGMVAQHMALRHPTRIERLVLAATTPGGAGGSSFPLHTLIGLTPHERVLRTLPISDTRVSDAAIAHPDEALAKRIAFLTKYNALHMDEPGAAEGAARQLEARSHHDCWDALPRITHETLVCGGLYDNLAPRAAVKNLAGRLPNATLRWYPGSHAFLIETPAYWADVSDFVTGA